jgi:hypothetical protein
MPVRKRRPSIGLVFACAWWALAATSASAAPIWLPPTDIAGPTESITFPQVAVNAGGDAVAIWPRDTGSETVLETLERPAGGDWSAPEVLSEPGEEEPANVRIGLDTAGNAVAIWSIGFGSTIRTAARPAGGDWSAPEDLSVENGRTPQLAMNAAGDAVAVWSGFDGVDDEVTWAAVRPAGGDWSPPEELSVAGESDGFFPQVAIDAAGNAIAVWQRFDLSDDVVQAAVRTADGDWSAPDVLSSPGENARSPRIAMNAAGSTVAAWSSLSGGTHAAVRPAGGDWSAPKDISAAGAEPALAVDSGGTAFALWPVTVAPGEMVLQVAMHPPGGSWSAPEDLSAPFEYFQSYNLDANPAAGVVATWTRQGGVPKNGVQAAVRPPGGDWSTPKEISAEGENSGLPDLGFDAAGDAIAIWGRADGSEYVLQGAGYDFAAPRLDDLQVPAAGVAGGPVSFAVSPFDVFSLAGTSWTFGDGEGAGGDAVSHVYAAPGSYPVTVSAADGSGNVSTRTETIAIAPGPIGPPPPPPRRQIELSLRIEGKSLRKLKRSGALSVAASVNDAANVALTGRVKLAAGARNGAGARFVSIFVPKTVHFAAGAEEKVRLVLSNRARGALQPLSRARLLIAGEARDEAGGVATRTVARTLR